MNSKTACIRNALFFASAVFGLSLSTFASAQVNPQTNGVCVDSVCRLRALSVDSTSIASVSKTSSSTTPGKAAPAPNPTNPCGPGQIGHEMFPGAWICSMIGVPGSPLNPVGSGGIGNDFDGAPTWTFMPDESQMVALPIPCFATVAGAQAGGGKFSASTYKVVAQLRNDAQSRPGPIFIVLEGLGSGETVVERSDRYEGKPAVARFPDGIAPGAWPQAEVQILKPFGSPQSQVTCKAIVAGGAS